MDNDADCNDGASAINPGADEYCDNIDNNCDGSTDGSDSVDAGSWYTDSDVDGYGDNTATAVVSCTSISGSVANDSDCNDTDSTINPSATEVCDSVDNDCDGTADGGDAADASPWYVDADGDGYGDSTAVAVPACDQPSGYVGTNTDCDDDDADSNPGVSNDTADCADNDCDGSTDEDATYSYTHDTDIQPIWTASCASCHPNAGLDFTASAYGNLVGIPSTEASGLNRVEECSTDQSYLWHKLQGTHQSVGGSGSQMPMGSTLTSGEMDMIRTWIEEGAPQ